MLERAGITVAPPPAPPARAGIAQSHLERLRYRPDADGDDVDGDDADGEEQDADELGGVSVRAVSVEDVPAYLEALLRGCEPFPLAPPAGHPHPGGWGEGDPGVAGPGGWDTPRRRWWSRRR